MMRLSKDLNSYVTFCRYTGRRVHCAGKSPTELPQHPSNCWNLSANRDNSVYSNLYDNVNLLVGWQWPLAAAQPTRVSASRFPTTGRSAGPWARMELSLMKSPPWFLFYRVAAEVGDRALIRQEQRDGKWIFNFHTRDRWGRTLALGELCCRLKGDERWREKLKESEGIMPDSDLSSLLPGRG